ncbi:MAG: DUF6497 family protein [Rhodobacteraceae bacterium]|nr:DUF6497 family protein [Paracoccaceae bacterium]
MVRLGKISVHTPATCRAFAAPAGGARTTARRRGCALVLALLCGGAAAGEPALPSGQMVELSEVLHQTATDGLWLRFRYVAPSIARSGGTVTAADALADMAVLCAETAVPYARDQGLKPRRVVISMADRPVAFGAAEPEATQYFELFRLAGTRCIWEAF